MPQLSTDPDGDSALNRNYEAAQRRKLIKCNVTVIPSAPPNLRDFVAFKYSVARGSKKLARNQFSASITRS
jgi:hypothetical protein